jgi:hypothetical protein
MTKQTSTIKRLSFNSKGDAFTEEAYFVGFVAAGWAFSFLEASICQAGLLSEFSDEPGAFHLFHVSSAKIKLGV